MKILSLEDIKNHLNLDQIIADQEEGFKIYSAGLTDIPPVGHLSISKSRGEFHIKYGTIKNDEFYVVKLAGGFYDNKRNYGISSIQGLIIIFDSHNGTPIAILKDDGYLTSLRTAIAGLIATKYLAPRNINTIGVYGTGLQARLQVSILKNFTKCRKLIVWGRNQDSINSYIMDMQIEGFDVYAAKSVDEIPEVSNLIITATASHVPVLNAKKVKPGTHITAVGTDCKGKQEIDEYLFSKVDVCVVDSITQCIDHGETSHAITKGIISKNQLIELGELINNSELGRNTDDQVTICDLTGVGIQDIQIAKSIWNSFTKSIINTEPK